MSARLRVEYDAQIFLEHRRGGISRYFSELLRAYRRHPSLGVEAQTRFRFGVNQHLTDLGMGYRSVAQLPYRTWRPTLRALNAPFSARPSTADVVHHTFYEREFLATPARRRVTTVHDMIPETVPEFFPRGNPHLAKRDYVDRSDLVICVSAATRDALAQNFGQLPLVAVVHLAVGEPFGLLRPRPAVCDRYVLHVGARRGYKNFEVVVAALRLLPEDVHLVCVGGGAWAPEEAALLEGLADRVDLRDGVTDDTLAALYEHAVCFVFPSRLEGFGLPVLEAMRSGCPAVLADRACFREVGDDAAEFFDPASPAELGERIERLLHDQAHAAELRRRGRLRAAEFTWARTAARTKAAYDSIR